MWVNPKLERTPREYLFTNVYTSFQHDATAPATNWAMGYQNAMFGSDYPHIEGTFGHTQKTLHELFDDVDAGRQPSACASAPSSELFPHVVGTPRSDRGSRPRSSEITLSAHVSRTSRRPPCDQARR